MKKTLHCSFCGLNQYEVPRLVASPSDVCICTACVDIAHEIVHGATPADLEYDSWFAGRTAIAEKAL